MSRPDPEPKLDAGFDWREIQMDSEASARAEAERQQALDDPEEAEWIYLKIEKTGQWVVRRTPRHMQVAPEKLNFWEKVLTVFNPLS